MTHYTRSGRREPQPELEAAKRALLAQRLGREGVQSPASEAAGRSEAAGDAPLSWAQERLWFLDQLDPGAPVYNLSRAIRLRGRLNCDDLSSCVNDVVRRHEILRTTFHSTDHGPVQRVAPALALDIPAIDIGRLPKVRRQAELRRTLATEANAPFDLARGPLLRARLVKLGKKDHVLFLGLHQMVCDGASMTILFGELELVYRSHVAGSPPKLPELAIQYRDYSGWQRAQLAGGDLAKQLAYWKERLRSSLPGLNLPADHARPARRSFRGARLPLSVPNIIVRGLAKVGGAERATLFMTLMAAFNVLLKRYADQDDIAVGFPAAQRSRADAQKLIGPFVNTLVLRTDLSGAPTFREVLRRARDHCRGALAHQDLPFDKLVDEMARERDLSRNPLFQVMFAFQSDRGGNLRLPGLQCEELEVEVATAKFDLTLSLTERDDRLSGFLEYSTDLFERATIERMARRFLALLRSIVADPDRGIDALPLLGSAERKKVLMDWNPTAAAYSRQRCMHVLFEAQARKKPRAVAVEFNGSKVIYGELNARANQLAHYLRRLGVGPEKLVGIRVDRSLEMVIGLLGILKAGAGYVPLDPRYPRERILFMVDDAQIEVVLTSTNGKQLAASSGQCSVGRERLSANSGQWSDRKLKVVDLVRDWEIIGRERSANLKAPARANNLAYVIYTSGSTGQPKGVAIEHGNAVAFLHWAKTVFSRGELAGVLASTSICFDLSIFEIFGPLSWGGKVILVNDVLTLRDAPSARRATLINTVPSALRALLSAGGLPPSVRTVNLAGEPLSQELVRRIYRSGAVEKVYDLYGPSETTTYSTFALRKVDGRATIGRPVANTKVYLLDGARQPVPIGIPGELYIGGAGVARGYWRRPGLTAEMFVRDPFAQKADARMYRTGDLARYLPDGNIEYLGRADHQVKVRGFRIELGEIEAAILQHPAVNETVVIASDVTRGEAPPSRPSPVEGEGVSDSDRRLVAYLVCHAQATSVNEVRSFLKEKLPDFMVPSAFVFLNALPRTPNGKVDRKALPLPDPARSAPTSDYAEPRSEIAALIVQEWCAALGVEQVGAHDNFFDLGGHSLLATRVVGRLRALLGVDLALRKLFELPTAAGLAEHVEWLRRNRRDFETPPIVAVARDRTIPLSFAQRRLWFLHKVDPGLAAYNMPAAYRIQGNLNRPALERALNQLIRRHESLRTAFVEWDGDPAQRILPEAEIALAVIDVAGLPAEEAEGEARRLAAEDARAPYDLAEAPLMRAKLLRLGDRDHVLLLNFHHLICDGSSLVIFYRELEALYGAFLGGGDPALPAPAVQYADFAIWQTNAVRSGVFAAQAEFWKRRLAPRLPPSELPADFERGVSPTYRGARRSLRLSKDLTRALKALGRKHGATLFMTSLATLMILLGRLSGREQIVVGAAVAGRSRPELDGVIGFFINALPLGGDLSGKPTFVEWLQRVREVCLDAYTNQDVPLEGIVEEMNTQGNWSRQPIFQVLFNMAEVGERELKLAGCRTVRLQQTMPAAKFDIVVQAPEIDGATELVMIYNAGLFLQKSIDSMLDQFASLLSQIAADPVKTVDRYSLVTAAAQKALPDPAEKLHDEWRGAVHEIVSRRAKIRPRSTAVADLDESWTYGEIDRQSSRLANAMSAAGIGPGDVVAIYAERRALLAPVLLGALKAAAVFVVLDPAYPAARLAEYLRIARPKGWLQMAGAEEPDEELAGALGELELRWRVRLASGKEELARLLESFSDSDPRLSIDADTPAYIAFTSGSTGAPKGVLCRHGPMSFFLPWQEQAFGLTEDDRYALLSGLAYNHLHRDLFTALASGAALFVPPAEFLKAPLELLNWLHDQKITVLHLTPALGRMLTTAQGITLTALRRVCFGGDLLLRQDVSATRALAPNAEIVSFYGATETQRAVGYLHLSCAPKENGARAKPALPAGKGAPGVQLLILTSDRRSAGIGEIGELYIRSPHLAAGYIDDDALTAANFIVNPFTGDKRDRLYRTAELGRYLVDGNVEWVGRGERRASIRGFRVELAEVEAALSRCPGVRHAAVIAREFAAAEAGAGKETRLAAYLEEQGGSVLNVEELRRFLSARLPHYMLPAYFRIVDRLPLNPSGKVDYARLSAPDEAGQERQAPLAAPQSEVERALAGILAQVLGAQNIGRYDNFFDRGGHSLLAAQVAARVRRILQVNLDLRTFLEAPTVAALAARIEQMKSRHGNGDGAELIDREETEL